MTKRSTRQQANDPEKKRCLMCWTDFSFMPSNNFLALADTKKLILCDDGIMGAKIIMCKSRRRSHSYCLNCVILWMKQFLFSMDKCVHKFATDTKFVLTKNMFSTTCPMVEMQKSSMTKGCRCKNIKTHELWSDTHPILPKIPVVCLDNVSILILRKMYKVISSDELNLTIKLNELVNLIFSKFNLFYKYAILDGSNPANFYPTRCIDLSCSGYGTILRKYENNKHLWTCNVCSAEICIACKASHHGLTCMRFRTLQNSESAEYKEILKNDDICSCPKCNILIHRLDGCNKVICTNCDARFCWICGFTHEISDKVYEHLQNAHGGYFG